MCKVPAMRNWLAASLTVTNSLVAELLHHAGRASQKDRWLRRLPGKLHGWTQKRDFPAPAPTRFRDWWDKEGKQP